MNVFKTIKGKLIPLICIISLLIMPFSIYSQVFDYTVKGRVIDENGLPIPSTDIRLSPLTYIMVDNIMTDDEGKFSISEKAEKGDTLYLYTAQNSKYSEAENVWSLIDPPFFSINLKNKRFLGKPIKFGSEKVIDLGDIKVQFWYNTAYFRLQINGRNLSKNEWEWLWCDLKDENGKVLMGSSIGPVAESHEVDLQKSKLKLSLPEGKWKLEFYKFDYNKNKIYPRLMSQTPYFVIDKDKYPETIDVLMQCSKCL